MRNILFGTKEEDTEFNVVEFKVLILSERFLKTSRFLISKKIIFTNG